MLKNFFLNLSPSASDSQFFLLFFPRGPQQKNPEFWKIQIIKINKAEFSLKKKI